jgi:hypothetical protein
MLLIASMKTRCCGFEKLPHARRAVLQIDP